MRRSYAITLILVFVFLGSLGAFWFFKSAKAPHSAKAGTKFISGVADAVRTKPVPAALVTLAVKTDVSAAPLQTAASSSPPAVVAAVNPESTSVKARIAIVIDDWGYDKSVLPLLLKIKSPVTIAVIPHHRYSKSIARDAKKNGYQVILHLPLESEGHRAVEKDTINCSMSESEIRQKLDALLESLPEIVGVNNHQGSKATRDTRTMSIVLSELYKKGFFFLDSRTTGKSICPKVAPSVGIKFAQSDGFIDIPPSRLDEDEYEKYVRKNMERLCAAAEKKGSAIMIGHDLKPTLDLLSVEIPKLERKGYEFVFLSDLMKSSRIPADDSLKASPKKKVS